MDEAPLLTLPPEEAAALLGAHQAAGVQNGNLVDVYVGRLRAKLPTDTITTVRNAGYALNAA